MSIAQPRLLLVDNYDSFTYNLVQAFLVLGADVLVYRNDEISVALALELSPSHLCNWRGANRPEPAIGWPPSSSGCRSSAYASATSRWCSTSAGGSFPRHV